LGSALCLLHGRAEPAPPRGASLAKRPWGVNPGITRRVFFSEGRTLCVRMARPHECRIPFSPDDARGILGPLRACRARPSAGWTRGETMREARIGGPLARTVPGACVAVKPVPSYPGVRSPPLRGGLAWLEALGSKPGDNAKGPFLGGTHSVRPHGKAPRMPRHSIFTRR
jgi:hypothetical protein